MRPIIDHGPVVFASDLAEEMTKGIQYFGRGPLDAILADHKIECYQ
jgi:hypothetical protein